MIDNPLSPELALARLQRGNARFVAGWPDHPDQSARRRRELAGGQQPYAAILTCADSRVPPEIVFDAGLGNLFVIRVAGNVLDDIVIGSLEYAVEHLHVPLIVVLGHDACGAVTAAVNGGGDAPSHIDAIVRTLQPAVNLARTQGGDLISQTIDANIDLVVNQLKVSEPILREHLNTNRLQIIGARYHLESGAITLLE